MPYPKNDNKIMSWAEEDRPREKLIHNGARNLSLSELIAILLGSGSSTSNAVELARALLKDAQYNLNHLSRWTIKDFTRFKGIGTVKAIGLIAALELGRRRQSHHQENHRTIRSSQDVYEEIGHDLKDLSHEEFWILLLNRANKVIRRVRISQGGVAGTVVDAKIIFKKALELQATSMILVHNHPSGQNRPSDADRQITKKIIKAGSFLEIKVLDHVIISQHQFYSFADEGLM